MAANGGGDLSSDGSDCYVKYMQKKYDTAGSSFINLNGSGKTTNWGKTTFFSVIRNRSFYVIENFGYNDYPWDGTIDLDGYFCSAEICASNKLQMYNWSIKNNSENHYLPMVFVLADPNYQLADRSMYRQTKYINTVMGLFNDHCVRYVKLFDAIDTVPYNGRLDGWNSVYYFDSLHPNKQGHMLMGDFLWFFVNGSDYSLSFNDWKEEVTLYAHYNETVFVSNRYWVNDSMMVRCVNDGVVVHHVIQHDFYGGEYVCFDIVKGNIYVLESGLWVSSFFYVVMLFVSRLCLVFFILIFMRVRRNEKQ